MGKTVIITGGTKGIGKAIALHLARTGHNLILNYLGDDAGAKQTESECAIFNGNTLVVKGNIAKKATAKKILAKALSKFSSIDVLINNAGINIDKPLFDLSEQDWDIVVDTNMKGTFFTCQEVARHMIQQPEGGHIINVSATTAIRGRKNGMNYCASKAGVLVMTKCLAMELGPKIRANCIIPGFTLTPETTRRFNLKKRLKEEVALRKIPLDRIGQPDEIARVVAFLISDDAKYINGQKIIVDGGQYMY